MKKVNERIIAKSLCIRKGLTAFIMILLLVSALAGPAMARIKGVVKSVEQDRITVMLNGTQSLSRGTVIAISLASFGEEIMKLGQWKVTEVRNGILHADSVDVIMPVSKDMAVMVVKVSGGHALPLPAPASEPAPMPSAPKSQSAGHGMTGPPLIKNGEGTWRGPDNIGPSGNGKEPISLLGKSAPVNPIPEGLSEFEKLKMKAGMQTVTPEEEFDLGVYYYQGSNGAPKDLEKAAVWFEKSAVRGNTAALFNIGLWYTNGTGVAKDYDKALLFLRKAADKGYNKAQNSLGFMYHKGYGVPKNDETAIYWYQKAADQGNAVAQYNLGVKYRKGQGVPKNMDTALFWYKKAAAQGYENAQSYLKKQGKIW